MDAEAGQGVGVLSDGAGADAIGESFLEVAADGGAVVLVRDGIKDEIDAAPQVFVIQVVETRHVASGSSGACPASILPGIHLLWGFNSGE